MRGDRPQSTTTRNGEKVATPHARGSTDILKKSLKADTGYPACAGIDPQAASRLRLLVRLPRMRGDRPLLKSGGTAWMQATPHARGSTSQMCLLPRGQDGYPACAGIDLRARWSDYQYFGLPRMRGDRPVDELNKYAEL